MVRILATGQITNSPGLFTEGSAESTYREGNYTIQFEVLPANSTLPTASEFDWIRGERSLNGRSKKSTLSHAGRNFKPGRPSAKGKKAMR